MAGRARAGRSDQVSAELIWELAQERATHVLPHLSPVFWHGVRADMEAQLDKRFHSVARDLCVRWTNQVAIEDGGHMRDLALQLVALNATCEKVGRTKASARYTWHMRKVREAAKYDEVVAELAKLL